MVQYKADLCMCASHLSVTEFIFMACFFTIGLKTNQMIELEDHPTNLYGSYFRFLIHEVFKQMITCVDLEVCRINYIYCQIATFLFYYGKFIIIILF